MQNTEATEIFKIVFPLKQPMKHRYLPQIFTNEDRNGNRYPWKAPWKEKGSFMGGEFSRRLYREGGGK
jgi:hypothetical protein